MCRRLCCLVTMIAVLLTSARLERVSAQDQSSSPEELNRRLTDTLNQLKSAQDRKNELATENEKLTARVAKLEEEVADANRRAAKLSDDTFRLRSYYAAWQVFMERYPLLLERWKLFLDSDPLSIPSSLPELLPTGSAAFPD